MAPYSSDMQQLSSLSNGVHKAQSIDITDDRTKSRHPRWTRHETFILIEGKKVVENRFQRSSRSNTAWGVDQIEPKWDSISSYCKQHGVNRGPVQCRKRWSNLLGDFKKIKTWETQKSESFWMMRTELRKERKLPTFFDMEVYDVLDGKIASEAIPLMLVPVKTEMENMDEDGEATADDEEEEETETVLNGGQHVTIDDSLFSDTEQPGQDDNSWSSKKETNATENSRKIQDDPAPISVKVKAFYQEYPHTVPIKEKTAGSNAWTKFTSKEGWKRPRLSDECKETNIGEQLIKVLERNSNILNAQLEAQNINQGLDRNQKKESNYSLIGALNRLTDAMVRIADKL